MKAPLTLGSLLLSVCLIYSCSKDNDSKTPKPVLKEYSIAFYNSVVYHHYYERDANGKLIAERDSTKGLVSTYNYLYNNNGKVSQVEFHDNRGPATYATEFIYNAAGQIIKRQSRSVTMAINEDYNTYAYDAAGHLIIDSQFSKGSGSSYQLSWVSKFSYTGDNATEGEMYQMVNGSLKLYARVKSEYDDKINPFKILDNDYYINEAGSSIFTITLKSANNVTKQYIAMGNGAYELEVNTSYQYNADNSVWKAKAEDVKQANRNSDMEFFF